MYPNISTINVHIRTNVLTETVVYTHAFGRLNNKQSETQTCAQMPLSLFPPAHPSFEVLWPKAASMSHMLILPFDREDVLFPLSLWPLAIERIKRNWIMLQVHFENVDDEFWKVKTNKHEI